MSEEKIITLDKLVQSNEDDVVLCHGGFNAIHPGHIRYFDYAKTLGEKLVVSIQGEKDSFINTEKKYLFSEEERAKGVASILKVDQVIILGGNNLKKLIEILKPSILVLGREFEKDQQYQVKDAIILLKKQGGKIYYHSGEAQYSSSELLNENMPDLLIEHVKEFKKSCIKQKIKFKDILKCIDEFQNSSLLVIGDSIVDQYVACDALGISAEAPVIVVRELEKKEYIGGAAIVAMHIQALGAKCHFLSVVGKDKNSKMISSQLTKKNIHHCLVEDTSRPTTFKIRYMVDNQKVFRVSRLKEHNVPLKVEDKLIDRLKYYAPKVKGILVSDFVYGVITPRILKTVNYLAKKYNLLLFGDLQCSSQIGNISKFKNFDLICPTERESRIAIGTQDGGIEWVANTLLKETKSDNLVMKLGGKGFIVYETKKDGFINRQHFNALCINPVDVAGAGDSLLSVLAVGLSSGATIMESSAIGAVMASLSVQKVGNIPITNSQLKNHFKKI